MFICTIYIHVCVRLCLLTFHLQKKFNAKIRGDNVVNISLVLGVVVEGNRKHKAKKLCKTGRTGCEKEAYETGLRFNLARIRGSWLLGHHHFLFSLLFYSKAPTTRNG